MLSMLGMSFWSGWEKSVVVGRLEKGNFVVVFEKIANSGIAIFMFSM